MKKRTAALLCALAVLLLCACGAAPAKEQKDIDLAALYDELAAREGMCEMVKVPVEEKYSAVSRVPAAV